MMQQDHVYGESYRETLLMFPSGWLKGPALYIDKDLETFILKSV
jgi:hypothetical protein